MKRICKEEKQLLIPYLNRFISEIAQIDQASTQWTLAQLFQSLEKDMSEAQVEQAKQIMKHNLANSTKVGWKFSRLRPLSFPTIRIAQLVQILNGNQDLAELVIHGRLDDYNRALEISTSNYWSEHYRFCKKSNFAEKKLGISTINQIIINAFLPIKFFFGMVNEEEYLKNEALQILEELPSEMNRITRQWKQQRRQHSGLPR